MLKKMVCTLMLAWSIALIMSNNASADWLYEQHKLAMLPDVDTGRAAEVSDLQKRAYIVMDIINDNLKPYDAYSLYSNDTEKNIKEYYINYEKAVKLIELVEKDLNHWRNHLEKNMTDKILLVNQATLHLALYSVLSRADEFISVLKLIDTGYKLKVRNQKNYDQEIIIWKEKANSYLGRARESIGKALLIDPDYVDAKIVEAQILALSGNYDEAMSKFVALNDMQYFANKRSYYNSWMAFLKIKMAQRAVKGNQAPQGYPEPYAANYDTEIIDFFDKSIAYMEPAANKEWATRFKYTLGLFQKEPVDINYQPVVSLGDDFSLEQLKKETGFLISAIRYQLMKPLNQKTGIRKPLSAEAKANYDRYAEQNVAVLLDLATNTSAENLKRHLALIENLYKSGVMLDKVIDNWDRLIIENEIGKYYYVMNKVRCQMQMIEMIYLTESIVNNPGFKNFVAQRHADVEASRKKLLYASGRYYERELPNYSAKWQEWKDEIVSSIGHDIDQIKDRSVVGKMMKMEYAALSDPREALELLAKIERQADDYKVFVDASSGQESAVERLTLCEECSTWEDDKSIEQAKAEILWDTASEIREIDARNYISAWKAYLRFKLQDSGSAAEELKISQRLKGMDKWEDYQEKSLYLQQVAKEAPAK